mmetsp:Transcript_1265/g.2904  ORF Transcript_1265/g.2904 Transcript_1265/m.2904 type:complete len:227 (-) Transcript_1265:554-1234(-)
MASSSSMTSQMPSQASTKNLSSLTFSSLRVISGMALTRGPVTPVQPYLCGSFIRRSPKARETARPQSRLRPPKVAGPGVKTRHTPCMSTTPPQLSIRRCSSGRPGLWSSDNLRAPSVLPCCRQRTARESPRLATSSLLLVFCRPSSGQIRHSTMVVPSRASLSRAFTRNSSSVKTHASVTACFKCSSVSAGFAERHFWRFLGSQSIMMSTQRLPEWPSKTMTPTIR